MHNVFAIGQSSSSASTRSYIRCALFLGLQADLIPVFDLWVVMSGVCGRTGTLHSSGEALKLGILVSASSFLTFIEHINKGVVRYPMSNMSHYNMIENTYMY